MPVHAGIQQNGKLNHAHLKTAKRNKISRQPQSAHPAYRPDIDGLRAVAIIFVIGFHAFPEYLRGGFIGVDVFFVISGFLISSIIFTSLEQGGFSFSEFYVRRAKRILPALLPILFATMTFGWFSLLADEYKHLAKHTASASIFAINFLLAPEQNAYFETAHEAKPLLHLWSLSVEEQFYILWPLLLWSAWKISRNLLNVTITIGLTSFALNIFTSDTDPAAAFFYPHTRLWELLIGAGLAAYNRHRLTIQAESDSLRPAPNCHNNILSATGGMLLAVGITIITNTTPYPGWWALFATTGAALIIAAGPYAFINHAVLSSRALVGIGLISYPLYLWHWPLLSYAYIIEGGMPPPTIRILLIAFALLLAWLTYKFIEKPVRFGKHAKEKLVACFGLLLVAGCFGLYCYIENGLPLRFGEENTRQFRSLKNCLASTGSVEPAICEETDPSPIIAIIGDSHAGQLSSGFQRGDHGKFNKAIFINQSGCAPLIGAETAPGCEAQLINAISHIKKSHSIRYIVVSAFFGWYENAAPTKQQEYLESSRKLLNELSTSHKKIIYVIDNPALNKSAEICNGSQPGAPSIRNSPEFCRNPSENDWQPRTQYNKLIERLRQEYPDILFFDEYATVCPDGNCSTFLNSKLMLRDSNHLTPSASKVVVDKLVSELEKLN